MALLSAVTATADASGPASGDQNADVGGQSLTEYQITLLGRFGISRFLVEVDQITGSLLQLADKCRKKGWSVEFVRSGSDIQRLMKSGDRLWVQSEALHVSPALLQQLLGRAGNFIASLDGRDENAAFERIDLNTRWAGIALVDVGTINALQDLPEGWSITSSVLRQALQDKVGLFALHQQHLQNGDLRNVHSTQDINALSRKIMADRVGHWGGFVEAKILAPIAGRIAPTIWRVSFGTHLVSAAGIVSAAASLGLGVFGLYVPAIAFALLAIILNLLRAAMVDVDGDPLLAKAAPAVIWIMLGVAALAAGRADMSYSNDGLFAAFITVGLALLAQKLALPVWAAYALKSPASLALVALIATPVAGFVQAIQWIGIVQLGAIIAAKWVHKGPEKKAKQA